MMEQQLQDIIDAVRAARPAVGARPPALPGNAVFMGSGDSLSSALVAARFGHRFMSSGDITWASAVPARCDSVVGISLSGRSGATVKAVRIAKEHGLATFAVTGDSRSPLAEAVDHVQGVPSLTVGDEVVPAAGHIMLAIGVAAACGEDVSDTPQELAVALERMLPAVDAFVRDLPRIRPEGISILTLPDLRSGGDFWSLKLIEATGVVARSVPLEESGHVDYFLGPQPQLAIQLVGAMGVARHDRLAVALQSTGQTVRQLRFDIDAPSPLVAELAAAAIGAQVAYEAAKLWERPPFRGGAVNMDAKHIKLDE